MSGVPENGAPLPAKKRLAGRVLTYSALALFTLYALYPVSQIFTISLRPGNRLLSTSLAPIPAGATLGNFRVLFAKTDFLRWVGNSLLVSAVVTITGVALASTGAYTLSRYRFRGRAKTLNALLVTQMFPATMVLLPMYLLLISLHLINSYLGVIIIYTATALPFCLWQLKGYYDTIPVSLEEAAQIDGCTPWQTFYRIILPLAAPGVAICALFSFMAAWNEYIVAALILQDAGKFTLPVGLKLFQGNMSTQWGLYAAGALLVSLPVIALFLLLSRFLVSGLTSGAVKE